MKKVFLFLSVFICVTVSAAKEKVSASAKLEQTDAAIQLLFTAFGLDQKIEQAITDADQFFTTKIPDAFRVKKSEQELALFIANKQKAKIKYDSSKDEIKKQMRSEMTADFKKNFSKEEIQYLTGVANYPIFKKLWAYLSSDFIQDHLTLPNLKISQFMKQAAKEPAAEKPQKH